MKAKLISMKMKAVNCNSGDDGEEDEDAVPEIPAGGGKK